MNLEVAKNSDLDSIQNICRLCSGTVQLVSVFNKVDGPKPLVEIVTVLTTIQISKEDKVSQKMCNKCIFNIVKMFEFREQSIRNDNRLKEKYAEITKNRRTNNGEVDVPKKDDKLEKNCGVVKKAHSDINAKLKERSKHLVHPSITPIFKKYPSIRLPSICIKSDVSPRVVMGMDEVENYFKERNLNMQKYINMALKTQKRRVAMKSTSTATISNFIKKKTIPEYFHSLKNSNKNRFDQKSESLEVSVGVSNSRKRKRAISSGSSSPQNVMESLNIDISEDLSSSSPSPALSVISDAGSDLSFAQSKEMHMCNICNSVFSLAMSLKKHQLKHLRCQFCKVKFRSLKTKDIHLNNNCKVQRMMKSMAHLPDIPLQKIEQNVKIQKKFQDAFAAFNLVPKKNNTTPKCQTEISKIKKPVADKTPTRTLKNDLNIEINIRNSQILNSTIPTENTNDAKMIKCMLQQYNRLHRKISSVSQTHLPTNALIKFHHTDLSIELKHLKQNLHYHKIPVEINHAPSFNASYKYDASFKNKNEISKNKKLQKWNDLSCCDISFSSGLNERVNIKQEMVDNDTEQENENELTNQVNKPSLPLMSAMSETSSDERCSSTNSHGFDNTDASADVSSKLNKNTENQTSDQCIEEDSANNFDINKTPNILQKDIRDKEVLISDTEQETTNDINTNSMDSENTEEYYKNVMDECNDTLNGFCLSNDDERSLNLQHSQSEKEQEVDEEQNLTISTNPSHKNSEEKQNGEAQINNVEVVEGHSNNYENIKSIDIENNDTDFSGMEVNTEKGNENSSNVDSEKITNVININTIESENTEGNCNLNDDFISNEDNEDIVKEQTKLTTNPNDNKKIEEKENGECQISELDCVNLDNNLNDNNCSSRIEQNIERDSETIELESEVDFLQGNKKVTNKNCLETTVTTDSIHVEPLTGTNISDTSTIRVKTVCELNN
ncbi:uncharacterized protein [Diabrotica undecimpunctata]|uniref:uncharacterized protein isoform X3 n=1 Tax=Diabrotica undecimpunctata TaxID=50387 RepID=UPI003B63221F